MSAPSAEQQARLQDPKRMNWPTRIQGPVLRCSRLWVRPKALAVIAWAMMTASSGQAETHAAPSAPLPISSATVAPLSPKEAALQQAMANHDWPRALGLLDIRLASQPDNADDHRWRGQVLLELDRGEEALAEFLQATKLAPRSAAAWNGLCWAQILTGQHLAARLSCRQSLGLDKDEANTVNLGHTYLLAGDTATAQFWYLESLILLDTDDLLHAGPLADLNL